MNGRLISWSPILILLMLACLTWWLDAKIQNNNNENLLDEDKYPHFYIVGYQAVRLTEKGTKLYSLRGEKLEYFAEKKSTSLSAPFLMYYDKKNGATSFKARNARLINNGEHIYFENEVEINRPKTSEKGELSIKTSQLRVIPDKEIARTQRPLKLTLGNSKLSSVGLEFNNKTSIIHLLSKARAEYDPPPRKP